RVMVSADLVRAGLATVLALWHDEAVVVYAIAFGLSAAAVFFYPAASSVLPALVRDEELVAANSGIWTAAVLSQVALATACGWAGGDSRTGRCLRAQRRSASWRQRSSCVACD
ncbi:MAG: hypothetical protein KY451_05335, partial [Actinobacteria bacterium]|nr:hypothetical protein [Actinomycetota bacterium]